MSVDPAEAVDLGDGVEGHATAEGAEAAAESSDALGSRSALTDALLSTEPSRPLQEVESPWNPDLGGPRRIMRAFQKMTGANALPAAADLLIGVGEMLATLNLDEPEENDDRDEHPDLEPHPSER